MRLLMGAFFFLFQKGLPEPTEPQRLAQHHIRVSDRPSVSNRANLVRSGSASRMPAFSAGFTDRPTTQFSGRSSGWRGRQRTRSRRFPVKRGEISRSPDK